MHHKDIHFSHFKYTWRPEIVEFYLYKFFRQIAFTLLSVFVPVYLYADVGYSIFEIMIFFVINQIFFMILIPFSGKVVEKIGVKHSIFLHLPSFAVFTYCLRFLTGDFYNDLWIIFIILAIRAIPKTPMITAETIFISKHILHNKKKEGSALAFLKIIMIITTLLAPLIGGVISHYFGFEAFFNAAIFILVLAALPLILTKDEYFNIRETPSQIMYFIFKKLPKNLRLAEMGRWMPDAIMWLLWPLFIYIILRDLSHIGILFTVSGIIAIIISYYVGKMVDTSSSKKLLDKTVNVATGVFFLRSVFPNPALLMITDAVNRIVNPILMIPYEKYYFDYIKSIKNIVEASVATNFILEFYFTIGFIFFALYFGILEYLHISADYSSFIFLFVLFGFLILLMKNISKIKR